ncbi:MAG: amidase [Proteobacteria bacterium]|nr:amidase [Pseudomonadota bacterium]
MTTPWHEMSACALGVGIADGDIDPVALCEHFLARIAAHDDDRKIYLHVTGGRARAEAEAAARRARNGLRRGILDGVPISWKDLFDSAGAPTTAASPIFAGRIPDADAALLARAGRAGLVCLGKTNLTEFAFSGLGINPHYGTPANAFDDECARVPGGSSSGAAVSVARGLAAAAIGSDTGGSVRIPAAWNGLVGLKTTAGLLPLDGVIPLAASLDTAGPLCRDVADANALFAVLAARPPADLTGASLKGRRLLVPSNVVWDGIDPAIESVVRAAIDRLADAGADVVSEEVPEFSEVEELFAKHGPLVAAEAYARWHDLVDSQADKIYHNVLKRFWAGSELGVPAFETMRRALDGMAARLHARLAGVAALVAPTTLISPPPIAELEADDDAYAAANMGALHNTSLGNVLKTCAVTLPCGGDNDGLPVGLMLHARPFTEAALLRLAAACETALAPIPKPSPTL